MSESYLAWRTLFSICDVICGLVISVDSQLWHQKSSRPKKTRLSIIAFAQLDHTKFGRRSMAMNTFG